MESSQCVYLGSMKSGDVRSPIHACQLHGVCCPGKKVEHVIACKECRDRLNLDNHNLADDFLDPLLLLDQERNPTHSLRNMLKGMPTFLVCGGPSAKDLPLDNLERRGIWSMAVNNMAGYVHTNAFVCADPPQKFHNGIWLDPSIMKFIPSVKLKGSRGDLRSKNGEDFERMDVSVRECPNVWGFGRKHWWTYDETFFTHEMATWGNLDVGVKMTGNEKTVCTMLLGIRLLYYLGSRTIFLVGVDFNMDPKAGMKENYAFGEHRDADAIRSNNEQFAVVNKGLNAMNDRGVFERFGLEIFNVNEETHLEAFPFIPFESAIEWTLSGFPVEPFDLEGWYRK